MQSHELVSHEPYAFSRNRRTIVLSGVSDSHFFLNSADDEKKLNATYIISVARKLGCSVFLLPEDIIEVKGHCYEI